MADQKKLKVAVIGPKGQCGRPIVDELLSRGHTVVGISRSPPAIWDKPGNYSAVALNLADVKKSAAAFSQGFDAIVSAYGPSLQQLNRVYFLCGEFQGKIKAALLASKHTGPFIIIGGAGSLHNKQGDDFAEEKDFCYAHWYAWPDRHLNYMAVRASDHGSKGFEYFIRSFAWARNNVEYPGWFSWMFRPAAWLVLNRAKAQLTGPDVRGLILGSRLALRLWEGVRDKKWSFLSPPWYLRDKGIRTGKYTLYIDTPEQPAYQGIDEGIYNEDMAVAIVDECENDELSYQHWTCTGPIDLKEW